MVSLQGTKIRKFYKVNLSTKSCFDISELEDIYKNCSECKQLPETKKVARNTRSCQKVAEQLVESPNCLACEFTVHYACKKAEMNLKSTTTNGFNFRIINLLMESWGQEGRDEVWDRETMFSQLANRSPFVLVGG